MGSARNIRYHQTYNVEGVDVTLPHVRLTTRTSYHSYVLPLVRPTTRTSFPLVRLTRTSYNSYVPTPAYHMASQSYDLPLIRPVSNSYVQPLASPAYHMASQSYN
ncbi:hypothetical protein J6590_090198 [Homalodisca vitripennis]|nr:hypothetical protein J6590_090198 [Homalodisca vitripennis]